MAKLARLPANDGAPGAHPAGEVHHIARPQARYYAFLSYSHKDEELADWLHRQLEDFRVPHALAGKLTEHGVIPKRLTPIFRDRHELAAADDLGAEIRNALAASQYLIVLCSPDAAGSRWTNAEIEEFKRNRPDGCVLAAIVAGEPFASDLSGREAEECFPPALRYRYDRRGRPTTKRAEPLAADLRETGDGRRMGFLKLVAGMLGVGLDDLVQRETLRRQRRLAWLAAASLAGMAITSTLAITAIQSRNEAREQRRQAEGLVGFMLGDLKDKLEPIGRLDALDAVGSRALAYYQKQDKSELSDEALAQRSRALTLMGEIAQTRGDLSGAQSRYQEALASTGEAMRRYPNDGQRTFDHAQNVFWVGYIAYQRGQTDQAAALFGQYKELADRMVALDPNKKDYRLEQVYAENNLGTVLMDQRRYTQAAAALQTSLSVAEEVASSDPRNADYQAQVENNLAWLAEAHEYSGSLEQAIAERERQVGLLDDLSRKNPQDTMLQRDLMTARRALGRLFASRGDLAKGLVDAGAAVAIADKLFSIEPQNTEWLQWNAMARFDLADLQLSAGAADDAATSARAGCDITDRLIKRNTSVAEWMVTQRVSCLSLQARLALRRSDPAEAYRLAQQAVRAARMSQKPAQRSVFLMQSMALGSTSLAGLGQSQESMKWARVAARAVPPNVQLRPQEQAILAQLRLKIGDKAGAQQLIAALTAMGYRRPDFIRIRERGGAV